MMSWQAACRLIRFANALASASEEPWEVPQTVPERLRIG